MVLTKCTSFWQRRVLFGEIAISPSDQNNCDIGRLLARAADFFVKQWAISRNLDIFAGTAFFVEITIYCKKEPSLPIQSKLS